MTGPDLDGAAPAPTGRPGAPAPPSSRSTVPPWPWLAAPVVVGLVAAGLLLGARHADRPAPWCRRTAPLMAALEQLDADPADPEGLAGLADAAADLDVSALLQELPPDLGGRLAEDAALWPALARRAAAATPGAGLLQVAPYPLLNDVAGLRGRYAEVCVPL